VSRVPQTYWRRRAERGLSDADSVAYYVSRTDIGLGLVNGYWIGSHGSCERIRSQMVRHLPNVISAKMSHNLFQYKGL
jgi:hypothetical protein